MYPTPERSISGRRKPYYQYLLIILIILSDIIDFINFGPKVMATRALPFGAPNMRDEISRVLDMMEAGKLTREQATEMIAALSTGGGHADDTAPEFEDEPADRDLRLETGEVRP